MSENLREGEVYRCFGLFVEVRNADGIFQCHPAGRFKVQREEDKNLIAVGDRVFFKPGEGSEAGRVEEIAPRRSELSRCAPRNPRLKQVIAANMDQVFLVLAPTGEARYAWGLVDRCRAALERHQRPLVLLLNKWDLLGEPAREAACASAAEFPLRALPVSALHGEGCGSLAETLRGRFTVFVGPSGAGKTTLLNRLLPDAARRTSEVFAATGKGRHTTSLAERFDLPEGGSVADTPGIREFSLNGVTQAQLFDAFEELHPDEPCRFQDCSHVQEPGCAVRARVEAGGAPAERWRQYCKLLGETRAAATRR